MILHKSLAVSSIFIPIILCLLCSYLFMEWLFLISDTNRNILILSFFVIITKSCDFSYFKLFWHLSLFYFILYFFILFSTPHFPSFSIFFCFLILCALSVLASVRLSTPTYHPPPHQFVDGYVIIRDYKSFIFFKHRIHDLSKSS